MLLNDKKKLIFKILVLYLLICIYNKVCDIIKIVAKGGGGGNC